MSEKRIAELKQQRNYLVQQIEKIQAEINDLERGMWTTTRSRLADSLRAVNSFKGWVTLTQVIGGFPYLSAENQIYLAAQSLEYGQVPTFVGLPGGSLQLNTRTIYFGDQ